MKIRWIVPLFVAGLLSGVSLAAPVIDGMLDTSIYGAPRSVQNTPTTFGNAVNGHPRFAVGGSELNAAYSYIEAGTLYLFFAMNLETAGQGVDIPTGNGNTLDIFLDVFPGGQNSLRGDNADVDANGLNRMGHLNAEQDGLKFDTGFDADFYFTFRNFTITGDFGPGNNPREAWRGHLEMATLPTSSGGTVTSFGTFGDSYFSSYIPAFYLSSGVKVGFRNSNTGGVKGTGEADPANTSDATNVTTGLELAIPLKLISGPEGEVAAEIKVCAFINDKFHGYLSNQTLGPLGQPEGSYGNLAEPKTLSFAIPEIPGNQYFVISNTVSSARKVAGSIAESGQITLNWMAIPGDQFVLETTPDLIQPSWSPVSATLSTTNTLLEITTNGAPANLYYRVVEQQF